MKNNFKMLNFTLIILMILINVPILAVQNSIKLQWEKIEGSEGYIVEIKNNKNQIIANRTSEFNSISIKLEPGKYSFRVIGLNKFNKPYGSSDWTKFMIKEMTAPEISKITPEIIYSNKKMPEVTIEGINFFEESTVTAYYLNKEITLTNVKLIEEDKISFIPDVTGIKEGKLKIKITNPGGSESNDAIVEITEYLTPEIFSVSPSSFFLKKDIEKFKVKGTNFRNTNKIILKDGSKKIKIENVKIQDNIIDFTVDSSNFNFGKYELMITNGDENTSNIKNIQVKNYEKGLLQMNELFLSTGMYYDYNISEWQNIYDNSILNFSFNFGHNVFTKYSGIEFNFFYSYNNLSENKNNFTGELIGYSGYSGLYLKTYFSFPINLYFSLSGGVKYSQISISGDELSFSENYFDFSIKSALFARAEMFHFYFIDFGVNYLHTFYAEEPSMEICPFFNVGINL